MQNTRRYSNHDFQKYKGRNIDDGYLQWIQSSPYLTAKKGRTQLIENVRDLLKELKFCGDVQWGRRIHAQVVATQNDTNLFVLTALINMYGKCGSMIDAHRVFDRIEKPDVVSWTALILGYVYNGKGDVALNMFSTMKVATHRCTPNSVTYIAALKACTSLAVNSSGKLQYLKQGREIHLEIRLCVNQYVQSTLIDMYAKCGSMVEACRVFDSIKKPDVVCWNALILGYVENGNGHAALDMFSRLNFAGVCAPDSFTYVAALKACIFLAASGIRSRKDCLEHGREIHSQITCHLDQYLQATLIDMYGKCGSMVDARRTFDRVRKPDTVSWNALMLGYVENGEADVALHMFSMMKAASGCSINSVTYVAAVKACTCLAVNGDGNSLRYGRHIHSEINHQLNQYVQNTLIEMYAKCGSMIEAHRVFYSMPKPDVVSWTTVLLGYAENGEEDVSLDMFSMMKAVGGCVPDLVTYITALKVCASIGALALGRRFHSEISNFSTRIVTCLVDFYAKCGSITEAREVFKLHSKVREITTWNALLTGYSSLGDTDSVFNTFEAMQDQGFQPDFVTFLCILSCCSHAGLVEKAKEYFEAMPLKYGVTPNEMHYNCLVDVLGRANQLTEAADLLRKMPCIPNAVTWMTLLGACCKWENVEIGRYAFNSLVDIDKKNTSAYGLMAHIYGSRGMVKEQEQMLKARSRCKR